MNESQNDLELIKLVQQGHKDMFNVLVEKYQYKLAHVISRYLQNEHDVAEACQEAFIKAYRGLENFRGDSAFYTWLYRIGVNVAKNFLNSKQHSQSKQEINHDVLDLHDEHHQQDHHSPERVLFSEEITDVISRTLENLPNELQTAFTLREVDLLSYQEIADIMECPVGTIRSRIFRAREMIDQQLQPLLETT